MRRHLGKARYPAIALLAVAAIVLFVRIKAIEDASARAAMLVPTADGLASALIRAGLDAEALAAAGASSGAIQMVVDDAEAYLVAHPQGLELADGARAQARGQCDQLTRKIQSGIATAQQINALPAARANLAQDEAQLQGLLDGVFDAGTAGLPQAKRATLAAIRANRTWDLPLQFLVVSRPQAEWVLLRECLATQRISADLGEESDQASHAALDAFESNPLVSAANANLESNLAVATTAWAQAVGAGPGQP